MAESSGGPRLDFIGQRMRQDGCTERGLQGSAGRLVSTIQLRAG
jgi:hypothetical protein